MEDVHDNQLVKRIAKLVQQNKELSQELKQLREQYEKLLEKSEEYESIVNKYSEIKETAEIAYPEKPVSLKFNMVTVLYADFHGFRELIPEETPDILIAQLDIFYMN